MNRPQANHQSHPAGDMNSLLSGSVAERSDRYPVGSQPRTALHDSNPVVVHPHGRGGRSRNNSGDHETSSSRTISPQRIFSERYTRGPVQQIVSSQFDDQGLPIYAGASPYRPKVTVEQNGDSRTYSQDSYGRRRESLVSQEQEELEWEDRRKSMEVSQGTRYHTRKRQHNADEFDGPSQYLPLPLPQDDQARMQELVELPMHLSLVEQDGIMWALNSILAECAFHFIAKYQFPIPIERDKLHVRSAADRDWAEWAYLIKRMATKRRIPARVLYDNQIRQLVTTLEHSIPCRRASKNDNSKNVFVASDDRHVLQLISAGTQVARILMDAIAMRQLNDLYLRTEELVRNRRYEVR